MRGTKVLFCISCLISISSVHAKPECEWSEYYDEQNHSCGPCEEVCKGILKGGHVTIGTEDVCRDQCSEYLVSKNCTYLQYYDHNTRSCAPCQELCDHPEIRGTKEICSSQCNSYMKAKGCTDEEYFKIEEKKCASCSDLCTYTETEMTPKDCFEKCPKYLEKNHPGNIIRAPTGSDAGSPRALSSWSSSQDGGSTVHPGVIVILVIGAVVVCILGAALVYWKCALGGNRSYVRAPTVAENPVGEHAGLSTAVQVSSQTLSAMEPTTNSAETDIFMSMRSARDHVDGGIPERDPLAPSSSTVQPPPWQSARESVV